MSPWPQAVAQVLAEPLGGARLQKARGERIVGAVGSDVPFELLYAAGVLPIALPAFASRPTAQADRILEPRFTPAVRSIVDQWLTGELEFIDAVVFSRADDSVQRSYYYLCELQRTAGVRGPRPLVFDVAKIPRPSSLAHTHAALARLAEELGCDLKELPAAIETRNRRRALLARLAEVRATPRPPPGSGTAQLLRAADLLPPAEFDAVLAHWIETDFAKRQGPRLLLCGTPPADERLHAAVELGGGCVVCEIGEHPAYQLGASIPLGSAPLAALATHYHTLRGGPRSFAGLADQIAQACVQAHVQGAICWLVEEDEALSWQLPSISQALARARVPLLTLTRRQWDASDGACEEIATFTRTLEPNP